MDIEEDNVNSQSHMDRRRDSKPSSIKIYKSKIVHKSKQPAK